MDFNSPEWKLLMSHLCYNTYLEHRQNEVIEQVTMYSEMVDFNSKLKNV